MDDISRAQSSAFASPTGKVRVGFFSFTEVTDPTAHHAYNEWHQLDHLPEQYPITGVVWGQRWVSTPSCRQARAVDGDLLAPVHYLTLYLMTDPLAETFEAFSELARYLHEAGRFHDQRHSWLSGPFSAFDATATPRVLVSAAAVPFRPGTGVYAVVEELADGADPASLFRRRDLQSALAVPGVAGVWSFATDGPAPGTRWRPGRHRITICYLDGDPLEAAGVLAPVLLGPGGGPGHDGLEVIFAGPFETIIPWRWDWFD